MISGELFCCYCIIHLSAYMRARMSYHATNPGCFAKGAIVMDRFIIPFGNVAKPHPLKLCRGGGPIVIVHI